LRKALIIAAALAASLPAVHATNLVDFVFTSGVSITSNPQAFTVSGTTINAWAFWTNSGGSNSLTGFGTKVVSGDTVVSGAGTISGSTTYVNNGTKNVSLGDNGDLGVTQTSDMVTNTSFIVLSVPTGDSFIGVNFQGVTEAWVILGTNSLPTASGVGGTVLDVGIGNGLETSSTGGYSYIVLTASTDCYADIASVEFSPNAIAPEPGTFVTAGMALLGLVTLLKKKALKS